MKTLLTAVLTWLTIWVILAKKSYYENYLPILANCVKQLNVTEKDGFPDEEDSERKCLYQCVYTKMGLMSEEGKIAETEFPKYMRYDGIDCDEQTKNDSICKRANSFVKCMLIATNNTKMIIQKCAKKTGMVLGEPRRDIGTEAFYENNMCHHKCVAKSKGYLRDGGDVNVEVIQKLYRHKDVQFDVAVKACRGSITDTDRCSKPVKLLRCILNL